MQMKKVVFFIVVCLFSMSQTVRASIVEQYEFQGKLGDKVPIEIAFCVDNNMIAAGYIYYKNASNPAPIMLVGSKTGGVYYLNEYLKDGTITGYMSFRVRYESGRTTLSGTWTNPKTGKTFNMNNMICTSTTTSATKYLELEDPQHIGRKYAFQEWSDSYQSMMGGVATFRGAGKYKVHFEISNVTHNIAEVESYPNRPADFSSYPYNYFYYYNANECGYGFSAHFYKYFLVIKSISGENTLGCFGYGASLDGVYIKVKQ